MPALSPARPTVLAAAGLVGGFAAARASGRRQLGSGVFAVCGAVAFADWARRADLPSAALLGAGYVAAMGGSHPLAKRIGAWPSVAAVTGAVAAASEVVTRRRGGR